MMRRAEAFLRRPANDEANRGLSKETSQGDQPMIRRAEAFLRRPANDEANRGFSKDPPPMIRRAEAFLRRPANDKASRGLSKAKHTFVRGVGWGWVAWYEVAAVSWWCEPEEDMLACPQLVL